QLFHPSVEDMARAEKLFHSSPTHKIDYYTSAERMDHVPALKAPEVSGTISSPRLWEALVSQPLCVAFVRVSFSFAQPATCCAFLSVFVPQGHTKKMNFFRVGGAFTIVDVPGYGHRAPKDFGEMVEPYLNTRTNLVRTFLLVDGSVGLQKADLIALEMCEDIRRPYVAVLTKVDKCGPRTLLTNLLDLQEVINKHTTSCFPQAFLVSSLHFTGIYLLRCLITHLTGSIK
ncbi:unnamed protein product, partial [Tetraodon nigroviridis]